MKIKTILLFILIFSNNLLARDLINEWYEFEDRHGNTGIINLKKIENGNKKTPYLFICNMELVYSGKKMDFILIINTKKDFNYTPVSADVHFNEGEKAKEFSITFEEINKKELQLKLLCNQKVKKKKIIERPVIAWPINFFIVQELPFNKNKILKFNSLETEEINFKKNHQIKYKGEKLVTIRETEYKLHEFVHSGNGISNSFYYVDNNHKLVYVLIDGHKKMIISTQKKALSFFKKALQKNNKGE